MNAMLDGVSDTEIEALAAHYSRQKARAVVQHAAAVEVNAGIEDRCAEAVAAWSEKKNRCNRSQGGTCGARMLLDLRVPQNSRRKPL